MNMKKPIISISSPTRSFPPPPLMTFLRTNFGSKSTSRSRKSRSRSRSHLIFRRTRRPTAASEAEPSSPKVTCIGQVRAGPSQRQFRVSKSPVFCCRWIVRVRNALFCFSKYFRKLPSRLLRNWMSCGTQHDLMPEQNEAREEGKSTLNSEVSTEGRSLPVPINAFLLTRCRSASSSLDSTRRFGSSPTASKVETVTEDGEIESQEEEGTVHVREDNRTSGMERKQRDSTPESKRDRESLKLGKNRETVVLKRCKSEPGRVMERLVSDPELDSRRRRKSEFDCVN